MTSAACASYAMFETGGPDVMLSAPFVAVWFAWGITSVIRMLTSLQIMPRWLITIGVAVALVTVSGHMFTETHQVFALTGARRRVLRPLDVKLEVQVAASDALWEHLPADRRVQVMGEMWPMVIGGRENATPFCHADIKSRLAGQLSGRIQQSVFEDILTARPDMVLFTEYRQGSSYHELADLLANDGYLCVGIAGHLITFIRPHDAPALAGAIAMQQALTEETLHTSKSVSLMEVAAMSDIEATEVAPGTVLVTHNLHQDGQATELVLYWWTWLPEKQQTAIRLETIVDGEVTDSWQVAYPPLPRSILVSESITLGDLETVPEDYTLRLIAADESPLTEHPCRITDIAAREAVAVDIVTASSHR